VITGASGGIGKVVAEELAKQGMKVLLLARRAEKLRAISDAIKHAGGEAEFQPCDVSKAADIQQAFDVAERLYGGVDFVFANAGVEGGLMKKGLATQDEKDDIQSLFDISVIGRIQTLKYAAMAFERRGGGTIAFTSSVGGFCGYTCHMAMNAFGLPRGNAIVYTAAQTALDNIAEGAHAAYHDKGVRVYNLNLGEFTSEMADRLGKKQGVAPFNPFFKQSQGNPVHVAEFIVAALDGTTKWPAGSAVVIDNDMTIHAKHFWDKRKTPGPIETLGWPGADELKKVAMDIKGDPYKFKDELCL